MATLSELVEQLQSLDSSWKLKLRDSEARIICPWHDDNDPSLSINLDRDRAGLGVFNCLSCPASGNWNKLAEKLGLERFSGGSYEKTVRPVDDDIDAELLEVDAPSPIQLEGLDWPEQQDWRGISGELIAELGGIHYLDQKIQQPCLYLPVMLNRQAQGGIRCLIEPEAAPDVDKYRNTSGFKTKRVLFPYDYVRAMDPKVVILVEGPRDALNLLQYQIPALSNLGASNAWATGKTKLLLDLDPKLIVLGFDRDKEGRRANRRIRADLSEWIAVKKLKLPRGQDPGDLKPQLLRRLSRRLLAIG